MSETESIPRSEATQPPADAAPLVSRRPGSSSVGWGFPRAPTFAGKSTCTLSFQAHR